MSDNYAENKGLKTGLTGQYSGKIGGLVFQKNGKVRINQSLLIKRKRKKS